MVDWVVIVFLIENCGIGVCNFSFIFENHMERQIKIYYYLWFEFYVDMFQHKRFSKSWFLMLGRNHKRCESWIVLMILSFNAWCTSSYWFMHIIGLRWDVLSHLHELLRMYILTDIKNHVTCDISFENMSWCKLKPRETRPWIV